MMTNQQQIVRMIKYIVMVFLIVLSISSISAAGLSDEIISGTYQSLGESKKILTVQLNPDHTAEIKISEKTGVFDETDRRGGAEVYRAEWSSEGREIKISYNRKTESLKFHEKLSFEAFGILDGVPGLKSIGENHDSGIIRDSSLWKIDDLAELSLMTKLQFQLKGIRLLDSDKEVLIFLNSIPGLILITFGIFFSVKKMMFLYRCVLVHGDVVSQKELFSVMGRSAFYRFQPKRRLPEIRFTAENVTAYEFVETFAGWRGSIDDGKVPVLYDPKNPQRAMVKNYFVLWKYPLFYTISGIVWICLFL